MAQNRDRNWQDRDQQQGGRTGRGGWQGGEDYGQGEHGRYNGLSESQGQGQFGPGQQRGFWDRASDEVSSWLGDEKARRRREMDEHRGRGPRGYTRSDERIRDDVNDREVEVSASEVTLASQIPSREETRRAEDIADAVPGVKHVENNLRVRGRSSVAAGETSTTQPGSASSSVARSRSSGSQPCTGASAPAHLLKEHDMDKREQTLARQDCIEDCLRCYRACHEMAKTQRRRCAESCSALAQGG